MFAADNVFWHYGDENTTIMCTSYEHSQNKKSDMKLK